MSQEKACAVDLLECLGLDKLGRKGANIDHKAVKFGEVMLLTVSSIHFRTSFGVIILLYS